MQLQEFYETVGGDYAGTSQRLYNDALILRVVKMYPSDPNFDKLHHALGAKDWEEAFRAAHTLTGVGQNLGFTRLYEASSDLTEALRGGRAADGSHPVGACRDGASAGVECADAAELTR